MGVRVKIMLPYDPAGVTGPKIRLSDVVEVLQPKEERPAHEERRGHAAPAVNPGAPFVAAPAQY